MGRPPRFQPAGAHFHVTARGVRREAVFLDAADYRLYLHLLRYTAARFGWVVLAYCLMPNHIHLLIRLTEPTLSPGMHRQQGVYARRFNERYMQSGHVFESRYRASHIESEAHLFGTVRYVARNASDAGICASPADWPWSSHRAVAGLSHAGSPVDIRAARALFGDDERSIARYAAFVADWQVESS